MINSKEDYEYYLRADERALGLERKPGQSRLRHYVDTYSLREILKFERLLRKTEYYKNCRKSVFGRIYYYHLFRRLHKQQIRLGLLISPNCFGPGLAIIHTGAIYVNHHAKIGANCRIYPCSVIGIKPEQRDKAPVIGNDVYIGPGAKVYGDIEIADGIAIGANAVVNKSFLEPNITIAGIPAKKVSDKAAFVIKGTDAGHLTPR